MKKQIIDTIQKCYSVNAIDINGECCLLFAGEGDGSMHLYRGRDFREKQTLWDETELNGGTMTIVTVDDREGYFFASTGFFTMIRSEQSSIWLVRCRDGNFQREKVCDIPYLHRFDVVTEGGHRYLIACTLHNGKKDKDDWSTAGKVLVTELPWDLDGEVAVQPQVLMDGLYQNHGFNRICGTSSVLIASKNGVYEICPPKADGSNWQVKPVFPFPVSDVCACDLDGDGELEYGVISPFHGNCFSVYKKIGVKAVKLYEHEKPLDFYHAIYGDTFQGRPVFVIGARKKDMDLYLVSWNAERERIEAELIESGCGSSNVRIIHTVKGDMIMSANRQQDEAAVYW